MTTFAKKLKMKRKNKALAGSPATTAVAKAGGEIVLPAVQSRGGRTKLTRFVTEHVPPRACNSCALSRACPLFRAGYECGFTAVLEGHRIEDVEDLAEASKALIELTMQRIQFASIEEHLTGNRIAELDKMIQSAGFLLKDSVTMMQGLSAKNAPIDGESKKSPQNIFAFLFGGNGANVQASRPIIEGMAQEVDYDIVSDSTVVEELEAAMKKKARQRRRELARSEKSEADDRL